jgi:tRNA pseudouridine55 synthase
LTKKQQTGDALYGILVLDKPAGWTSHDAVAKVRRIADTKKVGHLGTLDPLATGVLPLVIGRATRLAQFYTSDTKGYTATIRFGFATNTYDRDGEATTTPQEVVLDRARVESLLASFRGELNQVPPPVSAKKINGVPAYKLARQNVEVELKPVPIQVHRLEIEHMEGALLRVAVDCSSGTYIRSIAHELGVLHGCGAHIEELRRTHSGEFRLEQAHTLESLQAMADEGRFAAALIQGRELLPRMPHEAVDDLTEAQIRQGRDFRTSPFRISQAARLIKAINRDGQLIAIAEQRLPNLYHPILVL